MTTSTSTSTRKLPDTGIWTHGCFTVRVGDSFNTYKEIVAYSLQDEQFGTTAKPALDPGVRKILNSAPGDGKSNSPLPVYFTKRKCRDTSLGGNDAINPLPQFSVDDDIAHPHLLDTKGATSSSAQVAMGQVYSETFDDLQQILYLGFGIPLFSDIGSFWTSATDMDMANLVNKGSGITVEKIGYLLGSAPVRILNIATVPFKFIGAFLDRLQEVKISKYYSFSSQMPMYFRFVNTILVMLATNMNIVASSDELPSTGSDVSGKTETDLLGAGATSADLAGISTVFRDSGLDMARIMTKRYFYENGRTASMKARFTDEALINGSNLNNGDGTSTNGDSGASTTPTANSTNSQGTDTTSASKGRSLTMQWFDNFAAAYKTAIYDGHLFVGFRIDKGMGGSESFSNSVGESQISQTVNEKFNSGREAGFQLMHGNVGDGALGTVLGGVINGARSMFEGAMAMFHLDPLAAVATGSARIDIPEVWMSSSYSRSQAFTITCLAPYGDFETIFQSEYVPLACILAGALPRGTGHSSYSAPFVCQAYCRGVFSSPLCIIESLEVTRGADQFGMNAARLPLKLTMHVTLKDLSPVMYMNMGGNSGLLNAIMGNDDNFGEYMMTLAGMGLRDRLAPFRSSRRKLRILMSTFYKNKLSPYMLGMEGGANFTISRLISTVVSGGRNLPGN